MSLLRLIISLLHAYIIVSYISVSCSLYIFLPLSIVTDDLKHKVNIVKTIENAMSCNHKDNKKVRKTSTLVQ